MADEKIADLVEEIVGAINRRDPDAAAAAAASAASSESAAPPAAPIVPTSDAVDKVIKRPNGEDYHTRVLIGAHTDVGVLRTAYRNRMPVMLYGPPGTGKTAMIEAAFSPNGEEELFVVQGTGDTEVSDFIGSYVQRPDGSFAWVDGPLLLAAERGRPLFIDEIALIDPKAMAVVYGAMDGRREIVVTANPERGTVQVRDGFYVVGACNPNAPGARMSEALISRFLVQFEVLTDFALARTLGVNAKIVQAASNLMKKYLSNEVSWAPQLRELLAFRDAEKAFGLDFAIGNLIAGAPEIDRAEVTSVIKRTFGLPNAAPLRLG